MQLLAEAIFAPESPIIHHPWRSRATPVDNRYQVRANTRALGFAFEPSSTWKTRGCTCCVPVVIQNAGPGPGPAFLCPDRRADYSASSAGSFFPAGDRKVMPDAVEQWIRNIDQRSLLSGGGLSAVAAGFFSTWWLLACAHQVRLLLSRLLPAAPVDQSWHLK